MTTYSWPSGLVPTRNSWGLAHNSVVFGNPLTGTVQTMTRPGARWTCDMTFEALTDPDRGDLRGFLVKMGGVEHRASIYDHSYSPNGSVSGSPVVSGGGQTGTSLNTSGWSGSNPVLAAGDMFTVNGELKMVTSDASHSSGSATINFQPALRASPAGGAALTVTNPTCTMMLQNPGQLRWSNVPADLTSFSIQWVEVFT